MSSRQMRPRSTESISLDAANEDDLPSVMTPRKRQKMADLGTDVPAGLMTPPDSHHKRSSDQALVNGTTTLDEARVGAPRSAKRRRVASNLPEPNPPMAPFPTPSKSVLRTQRLAGIETPPATPSTTGSDGRKRHGVPATPESSSRIKQRQTAMDDLTPWKRADALPAHLANLLALHKSFDLALSLHVATHPPVLPPMDPSLMPISEYGLKSIGIDLHALTNYVALKPIVEKSCGKRFGLSELKRLMWLWQWDHENEGGASGAVFDHLNPFLDDTVSSTSKVPPSDSEKPANLTACYSVTPTRTIDTTTSRRVHTYGFGIRVTLTPREAASYFNTLHATSDSYGNAGKAVGAVARWSAGSEARCREVERRLWAWVDKHSGLKSADEQSTSTSLTPSSTEQRVPHIPCATLPQLQPAVGNLMPAFNLTAQAQASSTSPSGRFALALATNRSSPLSTSANPVGGLLPPPAFRSATSVHQKLQAVAGNGGATTSLAGKPTPVEEDVFGPVLMISKDAKHTVAGSAEERQRALFERIRARSNKDIGVSSSRPGVKGGRLAMNDMSRSQAQDELKRRSTLSRLEGIAEAVWMFFSLTPSNTGSLGSPGSSPRTKRRAFPISDVVDVVAKSSKTPISGQLCPNFLVLRNIARQEWLEMPSTAHTISSPGSRLNLAGPASPGKVVMRGGGGSLREVRERIRRELGDL